MPRSNARWALLLLALLAGCMPKCSCEGGGSATVTTSSSSSEAAGGAGVAAPSPGSAPAQAAQGAGGAYPLPGAAASPQGAPSDPRVANAVNPGAAPLTGAAPAPGPPPAPAYTTADTSISRNAKVSEVFPPVAGTSTLPSAVSSAKRAIESAIKRPAPNARVDTPATLAKVLPSTAGGLPALRPTLSTIKAEDKPISVAAQVYKSGTREVYVKVTDTAQAPFMRGVVSTQLSTPGTYANGWAHGIVIGGDPGVLRYYPAQRASQLSALVDDRYVVEVRVVGATGPAQALEIFQKLPLSQLTSSK